VQAETRFPILVSLFLHSWPLPLSRHLSARGDKTSERGPENERRCTVAVDSEGKAEHLSRSLSLSLSRGKPTVAGPRDSAVDARCIITTALAFSPLYARHSPSLSLSPPQPSRGVVPARLTPLGRRRVAARDARSPREYELSDKALI
jgi:hypothetical protein